ncbi:MAG: hypothetical protein AAFR11_14455 [Pseudomonadota bacterium]
MASDPDRIHIMVTLTDEGVEQASDVQAAATSLGLRVEKYNPLAGVVFGSGTEQTMRVLKTVPGVQSVREEGGAFVPPMDGFLPL